VATLKCTGNTYPIETKDFKVEDAACLNGGVQGRLALKINNVWGTACDDLANEKAAMVFCR